LAPANTIAEARRSSISIVAPGAVSRLSGGLFGKLNEHLDSYAVVANGKIVTVGARHKRVNHS
jgi:hypothetical protein